MNTTTPRLLSDRPPDLPVRISICAIVGVCRSDRGDWHNWHNWLWWNCWCTALVVHATTPRLLVCSPCALCIHCTIEWVACWHRACWTRQWRRNWSGRRSWRRGWRGSWRSCWSCLREGCGCASNSCCHAAVLLLLGRPHQFPVGSTLHAIEGEGGREETR